MLREKMLLMCKKVVQEREKKFIEHKNLKKMDAMMQKSCASA